MPSGAEIPRPQGDSAAMLAKGLELQRRGAELEQLGRRVHGSIDAMGLEGPFASRFTYRQSNVFMDTLRLAQEMHDLGLTLVRAASQLEADLAGWRQRVKLSQEAAARSNR
jgi:hypothetical protein